MKEVKVLKFGGTSMGSADAMRKVMGIVRDQSRGVRVAAVVVSAMSGVTDQLIDIAGRAAAKDRSYMARIDELEKRHMKTIESLVRTRNQKEAKERVVRLFGYLREAARGLWLVREISPRALDYVMSYGERLSAHVLTEALADAGVACEYLNARTVITTNDNFGSAAVDFDVTNPAIRAHFKKHAKLQIVTGFIAATKDRETTTLGRGGSDYTASIVGAALGASVIEIWTDVSGVMTADPRKVKDARPLPAMTYQEAVEMSYFGAKVIHPPTMQPALEKKIPILIKNTFAPEAPGTVIGTKTSDDGALAKGISSIGNVSTLLIGGSGMVSVEGAAGRLFGALSRQKINVILITQASSQNSISIAVASKDAEAARAAIEGEFAHERRERLIDAVEVRHELAVMAIVGERLQHQRGIAGRAFQTLGRNGINVVAIAQGSSELNISFVIRKSDESKALNAIHAAFFNPRHVVVNVFVVGTGVVGSALLRQTEQQRSALADDHGYIVRLVGIGNSTRMIFDTDGIDVGRWKETLHASKSKMNISEFVQAMRETSLPNSVFVDCTSADMISLHYQDVLKGGISIVTPNKYANSGSHKEYRELKECANQFGVKFLYETNVGAGLPVLGTLKDLLLSGDRVTRIEAVLSGTLSYIFDNFSGDKPFSEVVKEARTLGYAEPDPRADLSGLDVARKILILAREIGTKMELKDVKVRSLLSEKARKAPSVEKFFEQLKREDAAYEKLKQSAAKDGKLLRYVARFASGKASVGIEAVDASHPFYALYGNDNIVSIYTDRYKSSPLIIQGPGAGADVTAAGVFADILRTAVGTM